MAAERAPAGRGPGAPGDPLLTVQFSQPLLRRLVALHRQARVGDGRLPLIALNGPVGAGKSTLGRQLEALAAGQGLRLVVASIDDLYLPLAERRSRLAGNPFGVSRVPPGSHDIPLLLEALEHWRGGGELRLPRFDKTLANGEGDRGDWRQQPADALVLEGWLMGCRPLPPAALDALPERWGSRGVNRNGGCDSLSSDTDGLARLGIEPAPGPELSRDEWAWLPRWNAALEAYRPLWQACDGLWLLRPLDWGLPRRWRFQAEARQRRSGGAWLGPDGLEALVRASLCSLPPALYQDPLLRDWPGELPLLFSRNDGPEAGGSATASAGKSGMPATGTPRQGRSPIANHAEAQEAGFIQALGLAEDDALLRQVLNSGQARLNQHPAGPPTKCAAGIPGGRPERASEDFIPLGAVAVLDGRRRCRRVLLQSSLSEASSETG